MKSDYFSNRRTVRKYTGQPISDEQLRGILEQALRAPTTGNMQLYTIIVTRSKEGKKALAPAHFGQPQVEGCAVTLTICADLNRFSRWCRLSKADPGFDNFLTFTSAFLDASILAQQICSIAEMNGLGTCYLGTCTFNAPAISKLLELPELVVPIACLTIGYPADQGIETERLPLDAVIGYEKYPAHSDEEIMKLFEAKDNYAPNAQYVKENNKETLAQVYTDVRYPRAMNEEFSAQFIELLKQKGFMPK